jgi:hypothetical protein
LSVDTKKRKDRFRNKLVPSSVVDVTVQLTPTTASACLFFVNDESERGSDAAPGPEEPSITSEQAIIAVKTTDSPALRVASDIAGDIPRSLV